MRWTRIIRLRRAYLHPHQSLPVRAELPAWRARWPPCAVEPPGRRTLCTETVTTVLIPPAVFGGLAIALWTYKCMMMIIFQNKIIYMPSIPPFSRSEKVADYAVQYSPVTWKEHSMQSGDGTLIKVLEGRIPTSVRSDKHVVALYLQG